MHPSVLQSFGGELTKTAISARLALAAIKSRVAQGARVAPKLMQGAEAAAAKGLKSTPAAMRRTALGASEGGRGAQAAKGLAQRTGTAPQRAALQSRATQMGSALRSAPKTVTSPVEGGAMFTRGYSPQAAEFMTGKGTLAQAQAATKASPSVLGPTGAKKRLAATGGGGGTAVRRGGSTAAKRQHQIATAKTQIQRTPIQLPSRNIRATSGPGLAYERTMLRRRV